jgi:hypothetical protein
VALFRDLSFQKSLAFVFSIAADLDTPKNYLIRFSSRGGKLPNEVVVDVVEQYYVPCLCCDWLILEGKLHKCYCGGIHSPELSYPNGELPPDAEGEVHEFN